MAKSDRNKMIQEIEKGKYKNKALYYVIKGLEIARTGIEYGSSFLIPFINMSARTGNVTGAVTGLGLLLSRDSINSTLDSLQTRLEMKFELSREEYIVNQHLELLQKSKGIVTEETELNQEIDGKIKSVTQERLLQTPEISSRLEKHFRTFRDRQDRLPNIITGIGASAIAFAGAMATTIAQGGNPLQTLITLGAGIGASAGTMIYTTRKRKAIRKERILADSKAELYKNELINTEAINNEDKEFIVNRAVASNINSYRIWNKMTKTYANTRLFNRFVFTGALASLCLGAVGGLQNLTPETMIGMVSMVYFYSDIINKVGKSIESVQALTEMTQDYKQTSEMIDNIAEQIETKRDHLHTVNREFSSISIKDFEGKFYSKTSSTDEIYREHRLSVPDLEMKKGEIILISGESGSGKTTLFRMIRNGDINNTGSILLDGTDRIDNIGNASLFYTPTIHLGNSENVLNEITCGKSMDTLCDAEKKRLREICRGLKLDDMDENAVFKNDLMKILSQKTYDEFSVGQQQRLVLAKMLYLLGEEHQMIILDEPTANLDQVSANQVFKFIKDFCNRDQERIVLMCSHQVDIASKYSDRRYHITDGVLREVPIDRATHEESTHDDEKPREIEREERVATMEEIIEPEYYI